MVPAVGPVKRKRKADHRHSSSTSLCKRPAPPRHELDLPFDRACSLHGPGSPSNAGAVDSSARRGVVNGSNLHCCPGELLFVEDERETTSTDDESELSSMDGRSSPSHPAVSWGLTSNQGAQGFVEATAECFQTPLGVGFATPRAVETPTAAATAVSTKGRRVCSGEPTGPNGLYGGAPITRHHEQQHQHQQEVYESQEEQQQYEGQGHGKRQVQDGGRLDADVWGWFVDAGEEQPSRANVQNGGLRYY